MIDILFAGKDAILIVIFIALSVEAYDLQWTTVNVQGGMFYLKNPFLNEEINRTVNNTTGISSPYSIQFHTCRCGCISAKDHR